MASPVLKSTYTLDLDTAQALEALAKRLGVSKPEALRRAIREAAGAEQAEKRDALQALDELQQALALSPSRARAWASQVKAQRRAASARREPRRA